MKKWSLIAAAIFIIAACSTPSEKAASALARRVVPGIAGSIDFKEIQDTSDVFTISSKGSGVLIEGNNASSLAAGLGYYLRYYCDVEIGWYPSEDIAAPSSLVLPDAPVTVRAKVPERFFLNYCTFGYTMPWWQWEEWEIFIDRMALHGVNMPLACSGVESIWMRILQRHGMTADEIRAWFTAPAHLPWHRMNNIDGYGGPLPEEWIRGQEKLARKILKRERELSMTPVQQGFSGQVPGRLREIYPEAKIFPVGRWCRFPEENHCWFLSPSDPLFARLEAEFIAEQAGLFGTDHIYGIDLFNEVEPPSWSPDTLAAISSNVYKALSAADPEARWLQMGWMFYNDSSNWTPEVVKAYLEAVPKGKLEILDYYLENTMVWKRTDAFSGQPFILCYLGNFGGNIKLAGPFRTISSRISETLEYGGCKGLGSTLEGFGVNEFLFDYVLDRAWDTGISDERWIDKLALRRCGPQGIELWRTLIDSVYVGGSYSGHTTAVCARPSFDGRAPWNYIRNRYDEALLERLWEDMSSIESDKAEFRRDYAVIGAQVLANRFASVRDEFLEAYKASDIPASEAAADSMQTLLSQIDSISGSVPFLRLDNWENDAARWGSTGQEKAYYVSNAREIITTWGQPSVLEDYASRQWNGLVKGYYAPRWKKFTDEAIDSLRVRSQERP